MIYLFFLNKINMLNRITNRMRMRNINLVALYTSSCVFSMISSYELYNTDMNRINSFARYHNSYHIAYE